MCGAELERGSYCGSLCEEDHALYVRALEKEPTSAAPPQAEREDKSTAEPEARVAAVQAPPQSVEPPERSKPKKDDPGPTQMALL